MMKKSMVALFTVLTVICLLCSGALANGNGPSGGNTQQGGNPQQGGGAQPNSGEMPNDPQGGQGGPMQNGSQGMPAATQYGRFLDVDKLSEAVALMNEGEAKNNMIALMETYRQAVLNQDQASIREALQAMLQAMTQTMGQAMDPTLEPTMEPNTEQTTEPNTEQPTEPTMEQTQLSEQDRELLMIFSQGSYLDMDAVAETIAALTDSDAVTALTALLQTFTDAVAADDPKAIQDAFTALMTALTQAGVEI